MTQTLGAIGIATAVIAGWQYVTRDDCYSRLPRAIRDKPGEQVDPALRRGLVADCTHPFWSAGLRCGDWRPAEERGRP